MGNEQSDYKEINQNGTVSEKHENGSVNGGLSANITSNGLEIDVKSETTIHQNGDTPSLNFATESTECVVIESDCPPAGDEAVSETLEPAVLQVEDIKKNKGKTMLFGKMFKKKSGPRANVESVQEKEKETSSEDQTDVSLPPSEPEQEAANLQQESESLTEPERVTPDSGPEEEKVPESDNADRPPVENQEVQSQEENPVMNFFKTLVPSAKTSKKETAIPDATKDQSPKEAQPAATTTVAQISEPPAAPKGMSIPPPPPPEPPKMEIKGEPAAKPAKATPKEEPKAAAKQPESPKGKSAKDALSKFFRPKIESKVEPQEAAAEVAQAVVQMVEEILQPVVETQKVDPSKAGTLEAAAKPEPPPPVQEEKKTAPKSSFLSLFKPKVLLDHMTTKVQAASTSGVQFLRKTTGLAAEPKKATPAPPAAAAAAAAAKAKEEPKAAAKTAEAAVDKAVSVASPAGDDAPNVPRKLEKRNSIHLFFKNLGQKRHSTDAGVQTEPMTVAPAAEKGK
ncbi:breast carcinoma-amplified sequence 1 isoform X5 [Brachyistius frenatus]|uniref:breast carcinoma-amplified sequence 1 isoform X5 n=1 Tax=Brachyistius frenatus TaxID=100188 RepID=UPI0037E8AE9B